MQSGSESICLIDWEQSQPSIQQNSLKKHGRSSKSFQAPSRRHDDARIEMPLHALSGYVVDFNFGFGTASNSRRGHWLHGLRRGSGSRLLRASSPLSDDL